MGVHVDHMAEMWGVTRQKQDEFAANTHKKAAAARKLGVYDEEIVPLVGAKGDVIRYVHRVFFVRGSCGNRM